MDSTTKAIELGRELLELVDQASHLHRLMTELVMESDTRNVNDAITETVGISLANIERLATTSMDALKAAIEEFRVLLYLKDFESVFGQGSWRKEIRTNPNRKVDGVVGIRKHVVGMSLHDAVIVRDAFHAGRFK